MNRSGDNGLQFEWISLPRLAQISPTFGIVFGDFDRDGNTDLHLTQNSYSTQPETGLWRGGLSQLVLGNGDGSFRCVPPDKSGLVIADDGKASALVDTNSDDRFEIIATQNNGPTAAFEASTPAVEVVEVRFPPGTHGVGSKVTAKYASGEKQAVELQAGGGYLTQSPAAIHLRREGLESIDIRWPDGESERLKLDRFPRQILLNRR